MKKQTVISLVLSVTMLLGCLSIPASAFSLDEIETVPVQQETAVTESTTAGANGMELPSSAAHLPFGQASILQGCRTIDGMMPLAGSERRLATSQGVFAYEVNTDTVIYSYNPDVKLSTGTLSKIVTALVAIENC